MDIAAIVVGLFLVLFCGGGAILAARRGSFMPGMYGLFTNARVTREESPIYFWLAIAGGFSGAVMGLYIIYLGLDIAPAPPA